MLKVSAKNSKNQTIQLTQSSSYQLVSISGIDPPVASIATAELATDDGSQFNLARVPQRNIVLTIQPLNDVETTRTALYPYFTPKAPVTMIIKTGNREVNINGIVESFTVDYNANPQLIQVSIICPKPYFNDKTASSVSVSDATIVNNKGDMETGFELTVTLSSSITTFIVLNVTTNKRIEFDDLTLGSGDVITIDTRTGQKAAKYTRSGTDYSLLPYLDLSSDWVSLIPGNNSIVLSSGSGTIDFVPQYVGL